MSKVGNIVSFIFAMLAELFAMPFRLLAALFGSRSKATEHLSDEELNRRLVRKALLLVLICILLLGVAAYFAKERNLVAEDDKRPESQFDLKKPEAKEMTVATVQSPTFNKVLNLVDGMVGWLEQLGASESTKPPPPPPPPVAEPAPDEPSPPEKEEELPFATANPGTPEPPPAEYHGDKRILRRFGAVDDPTAPGQILPSPQPSATLPLIPVELLESYLGAGGASHELKIFATIKNNTTQKLRDAVVKVVYLDEWGVPMANKRVNPLVVAGGVFGDQVVILPGEQTRRFGIAVDDAPSNWTRKFKLELGEYALE